MCLLKLKLEAQNLNQPRLIDHSIPVVASMNFLSLVTFVDTFNKLLPILGFAAVFDHIQGFSMTRSNTTFTIISLTCLLYSLSVPAQQQQPGPWSFNIEGGGAHQTEVDLKDDTGGFAVDRWFLGAGVTYSWDARTSFGASIGGGRSIYEFNDLTGFGGGEPWGTIEDSRLSATGRFGFGDKGVVFIIPTIRINGEKGASNSDSRTYGLFAAVAWRLNADLTIGPGIGAFSRLEDGTRFFPILAIDWNISERWNLSTGRGLASSQGPGLTLSYKLNEDWSLGLAGRYEDLEFRLDDEGPAAGGLGRDQSFPLMLNATLTPNSKINLSIFAGLEFGGKLKLKDAQDIVVEESKYDPAPIFGGTFEFRF